MINQVPLLKQLADTRKKIHTLCAKSKCVKYPRCKKFCTVCTSDDHSPFRKVIRNNGGDFNLYLRLRTLLMEQNYPLVISQANEMGGYSKDDLCQEGMLGLCEAIDRSKITEQAFDRLVQKRRSGSNSITEKELLREVKVIRKTRHMGKMTIRTTELTGHLSRLKLQLSSMEIEPLESTRHHYQEHSDSFYNLLNRKLEEDLAGIEIWLSEAIKLRFGLGSYSTPTPTQEISTALGLNRTTVEYHIHQFFQRKIL